MDSYFSRLRGIKPEVGGGYFLTGGATMADIFLHFPWYIFSSYEVVHQNTMTIEINKSVTKYICFKNKIYVFKTQGFLFFFQVWQVGLKCTWPRGHSLPIPALNVLYALSLISQLKIWLHSQAISDLPKLVNSSIVNLQQIKSECYTADHVVLLCVPRLILLLVVFAPVIKNVS